MRSEIEGTRISDCLILSGNRYGVLNQTLGGTLTMDADTPQMLSIDPGGAARTVLLPPEAKGLYYTIINEADAAEALTVKEDSNTTTIATLNRGQSANFICNGTTWKASTSSTSATGGQSVGNVNNTTPTKAELTTIFGDPLTLGRGFMGTVDDEDADLRMFLVVCSDANFFWLLMTKAA